MNKKFRTIIGICFLIGSVLFALRGEFAYVPVLVLVGGFYVYKGVK
ncbi:hypothetical protein AB3331_05680 [Streptococcus sp. H49]